LSGGGVKGEKTWGGTLKGRRRNGKGTNERGRGLSRDENLSVTEQSKRKNEISWCPEKNLREGGVRAEGGGGKTSSFKFHFKESEKRGIQAQQAIDKPREEGSR